MTDATLNFDTPEFRAAPAAFRTAVAISRRGWRRGSLTFVFPSGREMRVEGDESGPDGRLIVHDFRFVGRVLAAADIGFGEGYIAGEWDTPDLAALLEAFTANFDTLEKLVNGNPLVRAFNALAHALNRNTRSGSRRNIQVHYDLGNAFYAGWLDRSMTYSSGLYPPNGGSLVEAQARKYAAMADAVGLKPGQTVLEIGCGWGGFAEYAARERGAIITGLTLSRNKPTSRASACSRRGSPSERRSSSPTTETRAALSTASSPSRCSRRWARPTGATTSPRSATCSRRAGGPACRSSPCATICSTPTGNARISSANISSRAACCPARRG